MDKFIKVFVLLIFISGCTGCSAINLKSQDLNSITSETNTYLDQKELPIPYDMRFIASSGHGGAFDITLHKDGTFYENSCWNLLGLTDTDYPNGIVNTCIYDCSLNQITAHDNYILCNVISCNTTRSAEWIENGTKYVLGQPTFNTGENLILYLPEMRVSDLDPEFIKQYNYMFATALNTEVLGHYAIYNPQSHVVLIEEKQLNALYTGDNTSSEIYEPVYEKNQPAEQMQDAYNENNVSADISKELPIYDGTEFVIKSGDGFSQSKLTMNKNGDFSIVSRYKLMGQEYDADWKIYDGVYRVTSANGKMRIVNKNDISYSMVVDSIMYSHEINTEWVDENVKYIEGSPEYHINDEIILYLPDTPREKVDSVFDDYFYYGLNLDYSIINGYALFNKTSPGIFLERNYLASVRGWYYED